jgi:hypothetical protein
MFGRDHGWARNATLQISMFYYYINAMEGFRGGINIARDFTVIADLLSSKTSRHQVPSLRHCPISGE